MRFFNYVITKSFLLFVIVIVSVFFSSCGSESSEENVFNDYSNDPVAVHVSIGESWNASDNVSSRSASSSSGVTVPLDNGWDMVATLEPAKDVQTRAATSLTAGVRYRVIAYKQNNVSASGYVNHADYVVGGASPAFWLPVNNTYTFVCYSYGSTSALPVFSSSDTSLSVSPDNDMLYSKANASITSSSKSFSVAFTHVFSQVTVVATSGSGNITSCSASLSPNYGGTLALGTGSVSKSGSSSGKSLVWSSPNSVSVSGNASIVFTNSESVTLTFTSITVGGTTLTNKSVTFPGKTMSSNTKYTLTVNFKVKFDGVTVGSLIWAKGNLIESGGVYSFQSNQGAYSGVWNGGDYWNWCNLDPTDYTNYGSAYSSSVDPCAQVSPAGTWRMPTSDEFTALINSGSFWGAYGSVNGRYFGTTSVPSSVNKDNFVFLPAAGVRIGASSSMNVVGTIGSYWSRSNAFGERYYADLLFFYSDDLYVSTDFRDCGFSVRCVSAK